MVLPASAHHKVMYFRAEFLLSLMLARSAWGSSLIFYCKMDCCTTKVCAVTEWSYSVCVVSDNLGSAINSCSSSPNQECYF